MRPMTRLLLIPLALPLLALDCGDDTVAPTRVGSIQGRVTAEGTGLSNVNVSIGAGATRTTDATGNYAFTALPEGVYTVSIAGFPGDVTFDETARTVTVGDPALAVTVDFEGTFLRTAGIIGRVNIDGVVVSATGPEGTSTATSTQGEYGILGLIAGDYVVVVNPPPDVACEPGSASVTLSGGETRTVDFTCTNVM